MTSTVVNTGSQMFFFGIESECEEKAKKYSVSPKKRLLWLIDTPGIGRIEPEAQSPLHPEGGRLQHQKMVIRTPKDGD